MPQGSFGISRDMYGPRHPGTPPALVRNADNPADSDGNWAVPVRYVRRACRKYRICSSAALARKRLPSALKNCFSGPVSGCGCRLSNTLQTDHHKGLIVMRQFLAEEGTHLRQHCV